MPREPRITISNLAREVFCIYTDSGDAHYGWLNSNFLYPPVSGGGGLVNHHATHEDGGDDEINVEGLSGQLVEKQKVNIIADLENDNFDTINLIAGAGVDISATSLGTTVGLTFTIDDTMLILYAIALG